MLFWVSLLFGTRFSGDLHHFQVELDPSEDSNRATLVAGESEHPTGLVVPPGPETQTPEADCESAAVSARAEMPR